ncbi:MAG: pyruvate, phosphate dikinase [Myxococcota bacterium]|nr:pyruvate, phosphate dikinase [Myxococcota bacterium]
MARVEAPVPLKAHPPLRYVYSLDEAKEALRLKGSREGVKALLGGKGANLAEMTLLGLPVPPGFILTTEACSAYGEAGDRLPEAIWNEALEHLHRVERVTGRRFGAPQRPLLVSCRSGAKFSMPGMMDTILNLGLNDLTTEALADETADRRFAFDSYRRLVQMFATVVLELPDEPFEEILATHRKARGVANDANLPADDLEAITGEFKGLTGAAFPQDPLEQLRLATSAVFRSWQGKRARDYRNATGIPHDLGTAVNVVTMVFGNLGETSGTGVATTRNVTTGENVLEGDFLVNAQGEDVVAGTRATAPISELAAWMPAADKELRRIARVLEQHFRDVQDIEFTVERSKLWMLQTRDAKRTARAAVRIAVELVEEKLISTEEAVLRVTPDQVDFFLHPQLSPASRAQAKDEKRLLAKGLNVSPGAAIGQIAFDPDTAERWARDEKKQVILVRQETRPDDVHGLLAAQGVLTTRGGRTSHAALVARQFGKPAVVGASTLEVDTTARTLTSADGLILREGDWLSLDGTLGEVYRGALETEVPSFEDAHLKQLLGWADGFRRLQVWTNADYPEDARKARQFGAQGIGLTRTEHMFFEAERLPVVQEMILAATEEERARHLAALLPMQRKDFIGLFQAMDGLPVTIRLIDPPLHEFLPDRDTLKKEISDLEYRGKDIAALAHRRKLLAAVEAMHEQNPMLGLRGVRLGIHLPDLIRMQVRAIFEAACRCAKEGVVVHPKIMVPLAVTAAELKVEREVLVEVAQQVMAEQGLQLQYQFGTMIEIPRAALVADLLAEYAEFFSFGTNDLTQTTFGISRDDAETGFLLEYLQKGILRENPFATLDQEGVGKLMETAVKLGRGKRRHLNIGVCGEHGGDPRSIAFCHRIGLDYVSCSPYRIPVARLAAAQAALAESRR